MPPRVPERRHSSSSCSASAGEGTRLSQGRKASEDRLPLAPLLASTATTLPPGGSPREWPPPALPTPPHSTPCTTVTSQSSVHLRRAGEGGELQAECVRLREELLQERAEKSALARRFDALSQMWQAAGHSEVPEGGSCGSSTGPNGTVLDTTEILTPDRNGSPKSLHSSVRTIMDESSIVPEASAVVGPIGFEDAGEASPTPDRQAWQEGSEEELVSTPLRLRGQFCGSSPDSPRTASPQNCDPLRGVLTEMTTSSLLERDVCLMRALNESLAFSPFECGENGLKMPRLGAGAESSFVLGAN